MKNKEVINHRVASATQFHFLHLELADQADILNALSAQTGRRAEILEKDIWLCEVLTLLFDLPCRKPMAFKGGTSLSKVYQAIERFSEDIDVTIDYRSLLDEEIALQTLSRSKREKLSDTLKHRLAEHIATALAPALQTSLKRSHPGKSINLEVSTNGEELRIFYPSAVNHSSTYLRPHILIEFGGRNAVLPQDKLTITADIASYLPDMIFPVARISVLSPMRTFWEKVTLIHAECHRPNIRENAHRLSRHWYDLAQLASHKIGHCALNDLSLLLDVVQIKKTFFYSGFSNYDACLSGGIRLLPEKEMLSALARDYKAMQAAGMFYGADLAFDIIIDRLQTLETVANQSISSARHTF
ncbi:MAG: nucleotidyl transferase AbiEii/AbiGii toxin family protein [Pantoea sp.]|uniref:nucleotidyl transferase AbiEii/AbiGii toxin family protein n=1 Tax=Pantoea sp. TaxID=69393 RepID=UPI0039E539A2